MKHTLYHIALLIIALLYSNEHHGQELLTIQEAVTIAMETILTLKLPPILLQSVRKTIA